MNVIDEFKNEYILDKLVGTGGQGAVFFVENNGHIVIKATVTADGKIVKSEKAYDKYRENILGVMAKASCNNLASPISMLQKPCCGYVMRFMEGMHKIEDLMLPARGEKLSEFYTRTGGLKRRYALLRGIARIMNDLYLNGLVYADLSPKNVYISEKAEEYETWLIDVDNLHYEGENDTCVATPMYGAPEVFSGRPNTMKSDIYSFALLAFELLTLSKPFVGNYSEDDEEDDWGVEESGEGCDFYSKMQRGEIPYVCSLKEKNNRQNSGIPLELVANEEIRMLFLKTFEDGRLCPEKRPSAAVWLDALNRAYDNVLTFRCGHSNIGNKCFLCNREEKSVSVLSYRFKDYITDKDGETVAERVPVLAASVRISGEEKEEHLPDYLFYDAPLPSANYGVCLCKRKKEYSFQNDLDSIKLRFNKSLKALDGLTIAVEKDGVVTRHIEFKR